MYGRASSFSPRYKFSQQRYDQGNGDGCEQRCIHCKLVLVRLIKRSINEQNVLEKLEIAEVDSRSKEGPSWKDQKMLYWRVQQHPLRGRKSGVRLNWQIAMRRTVRAHLDKKKEKKSILTCTLSNLITAPSTVSLTPSPTFISPIFLTNLTIPFNVFFPSWKFSSSLASST